MNTKIQTIISGWIIPFFAVSLIAMVMSVNSAQEVDKKEILKQQYRIRKNLNPATKTKAMLAVKTFENQISSAEEGVFLSYIASEVIQGQFENISPPEVDILTFHILCEATNDIEDDIRFITAEIETMNRAKQKLNELIEDFSGWIEEKIKSSTQSTEIASTQVPEKELPPVLKEYESMAVTPNFKVEYPRSPEITYSKNPEEMSLSELNTDLNRIKTALNSFHRISETASLVLQKEMGRRSEFLQMLSDLIRSISDVKDDLIKNIK